MQYTTSSWYDSSSDTLQQRVISYRRIGLLTSCPIYGIKKGHEQKLGPNWKTLNTVITENLAVLFKKNKALGQLLADYKEASVYRDFFDCRHAALFSKGTAIRDLLDECHRMRNPKQHKELFEYIYHEPNDPWVVLPVLPNPSINLKEQEERMLKAYPLLRLLIRCSEKASLETQVGEVDAYRRS